MDFKIGTVSVADVKVGSSLCNAVKVGGKYVWARSFSLNVYINTDMDSSCHGGYQSMLITDANGDSKGTLSMGDVPYGVGKRLGTVNWGDQIATGNGTLTTTGTETGSSESSYLETQDRYGTCVVYYNIDGSGSNPTATPTLYEVTKYVRTASRTVTTVYALDKQVLTVSGTTVIVLEPSSASPIGVKSYSDWSYGEWEDDGVEAVYFSVMSTKPEKSGYIFNYWSIASVNGSYSTNATKVQPGDNVWVYNYNSTMIFRLTASFGQVRFYSDANESYSTNFVIRFKYSASDGRYYCYYSPAVAAEDTDLLVPVGFGTVSGYSIAVLGDSNIVIKTVSNPVASSRGDDMAFNLADGNESISSADYGSASVNGVQLLITSASGESMKITGTAMIVTSSIDDSTTTTTTD